MIGVVEVLKVGQQIIEANRYTVPDSALWIYVTIFLYFLVACWPVSMLAGRLEKKMEELREQSMKRNGKIIGNTPFA